MTLCKFDGCDGYIDDIAYQKIKNFTVDTSLPSENQQTDRDSYVYGEISTISIPTFNHSLLNVIHWLANAVRRLGRWIWSRLSSNKAD